MGVLELLQVDNGYVIKLPETGIIALCQTGEEIAKVINQYYNDPEKKWTGENVDIPSTNRFVIHSIGEDYLVQQIVAIQPDHEIKKNYVFKSSTQVEQFFSGTSPSYTLRDSPDGPEKKQVCANILLSRDEILEVYHDEDKNALVAKIDKNKITVSHDYWSQLFGLEVLYEESEIKHSEKT